MANLWRIPPVVQAKSLYARTLREVILVRRFTGSGPTRTKHDTYAKAKVSEYNMNELVGLVLEGDQKLVVSAQDLIDRSFTFPITTSDKLVVRGKELAIISVDDNSRRYGSDLIAIDLQCRG